MELKTAIEILEYHQEWRLGKREDMIHEPKKLTEALEIVLNEVKKLKEYEEKNRWIPVEEKLPETYSIILATIKSPECIWVEEIGFGEGKFQLPGRGDTSFVTHWMYVPEPPSFL